jgi:dTDP-4-amino-4,6-dideoxygalactose transaminase
MNIPAAKIVFPKDNRETVINRINEILDTGYLTLGKYGKEFEKQFSEIVGTKYAITTNGGTSAVEIILRSLKLKGSEVIIPTNTFAATVNAALHAKTSVRFVDCNNDYNINFKNLKESITPRTKAVVMVHIGGYITPEIKEIQKFCLDNNLYLIEDAAHAHGSSFNEEYAGSFGIANAFSFYPTKLTTSGEGGMITTNNEEVDKAARVLRDQGKSGFFGNLHEEVGYNWRMSEISAVVGLDHLSYLKRFVEERRRLSDIYDDEIDNISGLHTVNILNKKMTNYYKYICVLEKGDRKAIKTIMKEKYHVGLSGEVYELPCHLQPSFKHLGYKEGDLPISEDLCKRQICLPLYQTMTEAEADYVIRSLKSVLDEIQ